ncbi:uncharacterized protein LOC131329653 [Rhododendron vialii]|uniref:uncharacterized protein LOC131329653 n=1 Tax=Rhododendron vialii TaxID=182163 RepID=UPI00265F7C8D|nr:uncharacterized protein LOC131329653 [Rhododendron vialii]
MDQTLNQFLTSQFVKKVTKLVLLAVSLFSFFFSSYSTLWHSFFINSFGLLHFSTFSFKLLSHAMDKNCIFLICNGILVFLAKSSGFFIRFSPENELKDPLLNETGDRKGFRSSGEMTGSLLEREASVEEQEQEEQQDSLEEAEASNFTAEEKEQGEQNVAEQKREEQNVLLITTAEEEEEEGAVQIIEQEEENKLGAIGFGIEEGGGNGLVISTEELNKKCDEFIRRMHEEIRIGAQIQS